MRVSRVSWLLALCALLVISSCSTDRSEPLVVQDVSDAPADYDYLIPPGTGDRIRAGEDVEILPGELDVQVGETIRIVNEDTEGHFVGIFYVGPNETVTQRFASPGEFAGQCSVHPSGTLLLRVNE
jgi:hypothetical protein